MSVVKTRSEIERRADAPSLFSFLIFLFRGEEYDERKRREGDGFFAPFSTD
jgi:hypothetical protein